MWRKIYSFRKSILDRLLFNFFKPKMVLGYTRLNDKQFLPDTRISNTTFIDGEAKLNLANNVYIGHFNYIDASGSLTIDEGCQIASYISILTHSSHTAIRLYGSQYIKYNGQHLGYHKQASSIGKYTFIGAHCVLMPGVHIGKGSIIQAFSYVKQGVYPDFAILGGNPAVQIGDTRTLDKQYLHNAPELEEYYNSWAKSTK